MGYWKEFGKKLFEDEPLYKEDYVKMNTGHKFGDFVGNYLFSPENKKNMADQSLFDSYEEDYYVPEEQPKPEVKGDVIDVPHRVVE